MEKKLSAQWRVKTGCELQWTILCKKEFQSKAYDPHEGWGVPSGQVWRGPWEGGPQMVAATWSKWTSLNKSGWGEGVGPMLPSWLVVIWAPPVNRQNDRKTWLKTLPFHKIHIRVVKNVNSLETLTQFNFAPRLNYFLCQLLSKCLTSNNIYLNISHYSTSRGGKEVGEHLNGLTALLNKGRLPSLYLIKDLILGFESQKQNEHSEV